MVSCLQEGWKEPNLKSSIKGTGACTHPEVMSYVCPSHQ